MTEDQGIFIEQCMACFKAGRGITLRLARRAKRLFIIPECLASDGGRGLILIYEGGGSYIHDGDKPLSQWKLVSASFPLMVAEKVAPLVNELVERIRAEGPTQAVAVPQLTKRSG